MVYLEVNHGLFIKPNTFLTKPNHCRNLNICNHYNEDQYNIRKLSLRSLVQKRGIHILTQQLRPSENSPTNSATCPSS